MYEEFASGVHGVLCTWERSGCDGDSALIVPDGCVDLVWFANGRLEIAGPDTRPRLVPSDSVVAIAGLRFAPAAARAFLGLPVGLLRDSQLPLRDVAPPGQHVAERLGDQAAQSMRERRRLLEQAVAEAGRHVDGLVRSAVARVRADPGLRIGTLAAELGVSTRHLHRRFVDEVGYGPKLFGRVVRLHRLLAAAGQEGDLGAASLAAGYASQSHMSDEVRDLTTLTPVRFVEAWGRASA